MPTRLQEILETVDLTPEEIKSRTERIREKHLEWSPAVTVPNFTRLHEYDLQMLFDAYDRVFFEEQIEAALGEAPLTFRLSSRMTRSAGQTSRRTPRGTDESRYEISVSTTLLATSFHGSDHRPISGSGIPCRDRLDALQRTMEHEIVHLIEMLIWRDSSCRQPRFQSIAQRFFGHTTHTHQLITPFEKAVAQHGIKPGMRVRFQHEGHEFRGVVNRITKRATVLVEDPDGLPYSDGKTYAKFYVPVPLLEPSK